MHNEEIKDYYNEMVRFGFKPIKKLNTPLFTATIFNMNIQFQFNDMELFEDEENE